MNLSELDTDSYIKKFLPARGEKNARTPREEQLNKFLDRLNYARKEDGFSPLSYGRIAKATQHIPDGDLHAFYQQCVSAKNFGRYFWWALKPTPEP